MIVELPQDTYRRDASETRLYAKYTFNAGNVYTKASPEHFFEHGAIYRQCPHKGNLQAVRRRKDRSLCQLYTVRYAFQPVPSVGLKHDHVAQADLRRVVHDVLTTRPRCSEHPSIISAVTKIKNAPHCTTNHGVSGPVPLVLRA